MASLNNKRYKKINTLNLLKHVWPYIPYPRLKKECRHIPDTKVYIVICHLSTSIGANRPTPLNPTLENCISHLAYSSIRFVVLDCAGIHLNSSSLVPSTVPKALIDAGGNRLAVDRVAILKKMPGKMYFTSFSLAS